MQGIENHLIWIKSIQSKEYFEFNPEQNSNSYHHKPKLLLYIKVQAKLKFSISRIWILKSQQRVNLDQYLNKQAFPLNDIKELNKKGGKKKKAH